MLTIGIMSGTSLDGADAVLAETDAKRQAKLIGHVHRTFQPSLRAELLALQASGPDEVERAALAANGLTDHFSALVVELLAATGYQASDIDAIGVHGQTIRHQPDRAFTVQINAPARLAEITGIDVIADFRSRDVAAGGHGAPLVPAFHAAVFQQTGEHRAVLNLGGIANLTDLPADESQPVRGWDCGPANVLCDGWAQRHLGASHDANGAWGRSGRVHARLLAALLAEPWLELTPPKSTGRDLFNARWLDEKLASIGPCDARDVQATLVEFTAQCAIDSLRSNIPAASLLVVCGGGAYNGFMLERLVALGRANSTATPLEVMTSNGLGIDANHVEAIAFSWLAARFILRMPGNLPAVTGAAGPRILGALYPA